MIFKLMKVEKTNLCLKDEAGSSFLLLFVSTTLKTALMEVHKYGK